MAAADMPSKDDLNKLQQKIADQLPSPESQQFALVYGGATKIKEYVFEATKLPEIRGASALLEWVNDEQSAALWAEVLQITPEDARQFIVYASGGNVLGFAPIANGATIAREIERCYTRHTQTAKSVAVAQPFRLLELRYGRLRFTDDGQIAYWVEDFLKDWNEEDKLQQDLRVQGIHSFDMNNDDHKQKQKALEQAALKKAALKQYYYYPPDAPKPEPDTAEARKARFFNRKKFGELVTVLAAMSNQRRDERQSHGDERQVPTYTLLPWAEKCDSSDIRPAVYRGRVGDDQRKLSEPSARKRYVGQKVKRESGDRIAWFDRHFDWPEQPKMVSWEQKWEDYLSNEGSDTPYAQHMPTRRNGVTSPGDLGEIGAASGGYIGMIYADGNNVGRVIARLATPEEYQKQSQALDDASKNAVFHALGNHLEPHNGKHPFEILSIGGDDILLIVPGKAAFAIALEIAYQFEYALCNKEAPTPKTLHDRYRGDDARAQQFTAYTPQIGLSAGVVIAHENAPVFFLRDLVEELLKHAKKLARDRAKQQQFGGAIDFMVLKSITMVSDNIKTFRKEALGDGRSEDNPRRLTARPYTWHEFAGLLATVQALQHEQFPRSQLYRLRRVMDEESSTIVSTMDYLYTRLRLKEGNVLQQHVEKAWTGTGTPKGAQRRPIYPWLPYGDNGWETIWPDLIEMYDIVAMAQKNKQKSEEKAREETNGRTS
jgi:CRISPR-associated protein Cmr2